MKKLIFLLLFILLFQLSSFAVNQNDIVKTIRLCQRNEGQFKASGLTKDKYNSFCECYIKGLFEDGDKRKEYESIRDDCM